MKSNKSAIVIIPPEDDWNLIQQIRSEHDKAFKRWMPHINLLYPFLEDDKTGHNFDDASKRIKSEIESRNIKKFKVYFNETSFQYFEHSKNNCTMWLNPNMDEIGENITIMANQSANKTFVRHSNILEIRSMLEDLYPQLIDKTDPAAQSFTPHLSIGQFDGDIIEKSIKDFSSSWLPINFEVEKIYLISRGNSDSFKICCSIPLA